MDLEDFNPVAGLATLWTRDQLTHANLDWLRSLPQGPVHVEELPGIQFVHGSALDEDEYMVSVRDAIEPLITNAVPVTFFGHTHLQGGFMLQGEISEAYRPGYRTVGQPESSDWPLRKDSVISSIPARLASLAMATGALPSPCSTAMPGSSLLSRAL